MNFTQIASFSLLLWTEIALAACPTDIKGQSEQYLVEITQDCGIESKIRVSKINEDTNEYTKSYQSALFDTECKFLDDASKLFCRSKGKTILSGATFKLTEDGIPQCVGDSIEYRYTCVKGCTKAVPKYLSIAPYEC